MRNIGGSHLALSSFFFQLPTWTCCYCLRNFIVKWVKGENLRFLIFLSLRGKFRCDLSCHLCTHYHEMTCCNGWRVLIRAPQVIVCKFAGHVSWEVNIGLFELMRKISAFAVRTSCLGIDGVRLRIDGVRVLKWGIQYDAYVIIVNIWTSRTLMTCQMLCKQRLLCQILVLWTLSLNVIFHLETTNTCKNYHEHM